MKAGRIADPSLRPLTDEQFAEVMHGLSQPLTALECGLELAIRYDTTLTQVRHRLKVLLEAAQILHQGFQELRAMQNAPVPADRQSPFRLDKP